MPMRCSIFGCKLCMQSCNSPQCPFSMLLLVGHTYILSPSPFLWFLSFSFFHLLLCSHSRSHLGGPSLVYVRHAWAVLAQGSGVDDMFCLPQDFWPISIAYAGPPGCGCFRSSAPFLSNSPIQPHHHGGRRLHIS